MAGTVVADGGMVMSAFASAMAAVGIEGEALAIAQAYARRTTDLSKAAVFAALLDEGGLLDQAKTLGRPSIDIHGNSGTAGHAGSKSASSEYGRASTAVRAFGSAVLAAITEGRVTEVPGAQAAMEALRCAGIKICLTTALPAEIQGAVVAHLGWGHLVDLLIAPSEGVRGRPYPDIVLTAALRLALDDVRRVAVVGDTTNDLWSGYRAGAGVVAGVLTGSHERSDLERAPHTHILSSIVDLPPLLANWAPEVLPTQTTTLRFDRRPVLVG
jgi:phosphonatase-like hydrolase